MIIAHTPVTFLWLAADAWTAIGTVGLAVIAALTAGYARRQLSLAQRTREEETRPYVVVDVEPSPVSFRIVNLVVENIGRTVARDVKLTFEPDLQTALDQYALEDSALILEGVATMPPRRRIVAMFDHAPDLKKSNLPKRYEVNVTFSDSRNRMHTLPYVLDLNVLFGLSHITEYGVHHVAASLREIEKRYRKGTDIHGRLKIWVRDEDQRDRDDAVEHSLTGRWPSLATTTPPDWIMAIGRNPFVRGAIEAIPPLKRWLHRRL